MSTHTLTASGSAAPVARRRDGLLLAAFKVDAVASVGTGLAYLIAAVPLADLLGLPSGLLRAVGAFSIVYGLYVGYLGTRPRASAQAGVLIAIGNLGWVAASVVMLVAGWHDPTTAGTVWIAAQALLVAGFAEAQLIGARRIRAAR
jgi:CHASE2 domain-containing sensor protein